MPIWKFENCVSLIEHGMENPWEPYPNGTPGRSRKYFTIFLSIFSPPETCCSTSRHGESECGERGVPWLQVLGRPQRRVPRWRLCFQLPPHFSLVGGFKHVLFSISCIGCHPSHWPMNIFQDGYCTINQFTPKTVPGEGTLLPLWRFSSEKAKKKQAQGPTVGRWRLSPLSKYRIYPELEVYNGYNGW